jgi:hypothetical protein
VGSQNLINLLRIQGLLKEIPQSQYAHSGTLMHAAWLAERKKGILPARFLTASK